MQKTRGTVIHISFLPGVLMFQPERIWTALRRAGGSGKVSGSVVTSLLAGLGDTAIHLAKREYVLRAAVKRLKESLTALGNLIPDSIPVRQGYRVVGNARIYEERDRSLLALDSVLFEFRSYLELLAIFTYKLLVAIGKPPPSKYGHSSGVELVIVGGHGKVKSHNLLRYLCDELSYPEDWYIFLSTHRNFFTHNGAPYIAVEDRGVIPRELHFLIMRTKIHDFATADHNDYFDLAELQKVVNGVKTLARAIQVKLVNLLEA